MHASPVQAVRKNDRGKHIVVHNDYGVTGKEKWRIQAEIF
jgi:hypothetical protein